MNLRPINKNVVFEFLDKTIKKDGKKQFQTTTESGLIIQSFDNSTSEDRWGVVKSVGPDVKSDIKVGDVILVEALKWTSSFEVSKDVVVWLTSEDHILLIKDEE